MSNIATEIKKEISHTEPTTESILPILDDIILSFSNEGGALIPVLQSVQNLLGYLPEDALKHISFKLKIPFSEVTGVVTFYSYFSTIPRGEYIVRVCLGTACYVRGGKEVLSAFRNYLGINVGETTEDKLYSLEIGRCFGACGLAPVVMINDDVHQRVKPSKIKELLKSYRRESNE